MQRMIQQIPERVADGLAVTSGTLFAASWLHDLDTLVSIVAGVVAIIAGLSAAYYHITKARQLKRENRDD